jgi:hypothetical protein
MAEEGPEFRSCGVCGRSILRGERVSDYATPEGDVVLVCALCKPRAENSGWVPAALADTVATRGGSGRRRGINLRERLSRASGAATGRVRARDRANAGDNHAGEAPPENDVPRREREPEPTHAAPAPERRPRSAQARLRAALEAFNASPEVRKVAGLVRSLGEASASAHARGERVVITVAWELSWYQWEVGDDGDVRELRKGRELAELSRRDREWNARVGDGGELESLRPADRAGRHES